ncbi:MAG: phage recombination protein Bet [Ureaplasma parvum]|uniref:phage recombination protein Bet n=1 Tax=Ureaplasma parvum TaxID=134821 RepID=UPI0029061C0E|nr:phage recombination protein Bet [Ureaplasma parvum]MDU7892043.1 phage recombination protein Bet [Ureaplasma parvum]
MIKDDKLVPSVKLLTPNELSEQWANPNSEINQITRAVLSIQGIDLKAIDLNQAAQIIYFCQANNLNPLNKEVYLIQMGNRLAPIVGIHTMTERAYKTERLVGITQSYDDVNKSAKTILTIRAPGLKGFGTVEAEVFLSEYSTNKNLWVTKPITMLKKVSLAHALRLSGLLAFKGDTPYIYEEMQQGETTPVKKMFTPPVQEVIEPQKIEQIKKVDFNEF